MTTPVLQQLADSQSSPEVILNENAETLGAWALFGLHQPSTPSGLTLGLYGGRWNNNTIGTAYGDTETLHVTLALTDATTNYVVANRSTGALSASTATTNWDDTATYGRVRKVATASGAMTDHEDWRNQPGGIFDFSSTATGAVVSVNGMDGVVVLDAADVGAAEAVHSHTSADISNFSEAVDDRVAALLVAGTNVTVAYDDGANTLTIAASGGGISDGDKGDITVSGTGATWTIDNDAASNAKLANMATQTIKGRTAAGTGDPEDLTAAQAAAIVQGDGLTVDLAGFRGVPQNAQGSNYTLVAADAGKHIYHASGDGSGDTYTIPANGSVAFPVGTTVTFVNDDSNAVSIAITTDTLALAGAGTTGTRTLAQYGVATAIKVTSTRWLISGTGLT
jgi:hypothetical protein